MDKINNTLFNRIIFPFLFLTIGCLVACSDDEPGNRVPSISDQSFSLSESAEKDFIIGTITASDPDGNELLFTIVSGNTGNVFAIGSFSGELTIKSTDNLNFGQTSEYGLTIKVSDGLLESTAVITITIIDENRVPEIEDQSFDVSEDAKVGDEIGQIQASDPDAEGLTYSIISGNSEGLFGIDPTNGNLSLTSVATLDFETKDRYALAVSVKDAALLQATATITINVLDVLELTPFFTLAGNEYEMKDGLIREFGVTTTSSFHFVRTFALADGDYFFSVVDDDFRVNGGSIGVFSVLFSAGSQSFKPGSFNYIDTATTSLVDVLGQSFIHSSAFIIDANNDGNVSINVDDVVYGITGGTVSVSEIGLSDYSIVYDVEITLFDVATSQYVNSVKSDLHFEYSGPLEFSDQKAGVGGRTESGSLNENELKFLKANVKQ